MKKDEPITRCRMSHDDMAEAVRLWKENDPGLDQYLKDHGINHIGKWKQNAKVRYGKAAPAAVVKVDGPLRIETDEPEKIEVVPEAPKHRNHTLLRNSNYTVSAIRTDLGEFYYDKKFNKIDWRTPEGEEVSMDPHSWFMLYEMIPEFMGILEVDGDV